MPAVAPIRMTADEINCLVYAYLQDSGFNHTAYNLRNESQLDLSPHIRTHVKRGALVDLLGKALLYLEVETHWRANAVTASCTAPFTLLEEHVCPADAKTRPLPLAERLMEALALDMADGAKTNGSTGDKRKAAEMAAAEDRNEKRVRTSSPMDNREDGPSTVFSNSGVNRAQFSSDTTVSAPQKSLQLSTTSYAIRKCHGHEAEVFVCKWNPVYPNILASGDKVAVVHLWDVPPLSGVKPYTVPAAISPNNTNRTSSAEMCDLTALDWSPDGNYLAVASYDAVMRVLTKTGDTYMSSPQHKGPVFASKFSSSGARLLTGSLDGTTCVWDMATKQLETMYRCHVDCCLDVAWIDETTFATCGADKLVNIMRVGEQKPLVTLTGHTNEVNMLDYNVKYMRLASCSDDRSARIWNIQEILKRESSQIPGLSDSNSEAVVLIGHKNNVSTVDWCPVDYPGVGPIVATTSFDGTTRLWDSTTGECLKMFNDHKTPVFAVCFSPDGRFVTTGGGDGWLYVYDVKNRSKRWQWDVSDGLPDMPEGETTESLKMVSKGIFEIDWQSAPDCNRIAVTLETKQVAIVDTKRIPELL